MQVWRDTDASALEPLDGELADALLEVSDALALVGRRSLSEVAGDVTLTQFHALVELGARTGCAIVELARALDVDRSTAARMSERLARKGLVRRQRLRGDRRIVRVSLTDAGCELVDEVSERRSAEASRIARRIAAEDRPLLTTWLREVVAAAGDNGAELRTNHGSSRRATPNCAEHRDDPRASNPAAMILSLEGQPYVSR